MKKETKITVFNLMILLATLIVVTWLYDGTRYLRYAQTIYVPVEQTYDVVAFGDSLVEGLGARYGNDFVSILSENLGVEILNLGKRRETTDTALERIDQILAFEPKVALLVLGGNDVFFEIPIEKRLENLEKIITPLKENNIDVVFAGTRTGVLNDPYQDQVQELMNNLDVTFIPNILEDILYNPVNLFDPLHPNDRGHRIIAERIEPSLREVLVDALLQDF